MAQRSVDNIFLRISDALKDEFNRRVNIENLKVIYVTSLAGLGFLVLLLYIDYIRYQSGKLSGDPLYEFLFYNHLLFGLFLIPVVVIARHREKIKAGTYRFANTLTYLWIVICGLVILTMAILSIWVRGALMLYVVYIFLLNFVIIMPHRVRFIFNLASFSIIVGAIMVIYTGDQEMLIIKTIEALGVTVPAFIVSTYRYNTLIRQLNSEKLLASKNEALEEEKQRSEDLLLNILPLAIAEELKENGKVIPKYYDSISIMFVDVEGFSNIARALSPGKLVFDLDYCFSGLDEIVEQYQIEKIKMMGDAYICVAGFKSQKDHPIRMIKVAKEMLAFIERWNKEKSNKGEMPFQIRIGIHTGPVVAGVVGLKKFAFDIWGDTVNIASRLEANSEVGKINISENTYRHIKDEVACISRGKVAVKNAGEINMYFVS